MINMISGEVQFMLYGVGIETGKLTASAVSCQGGTKNVTDLCAVARELELRDSVAWGSATGTGRDTGAPSSSIDSDRDKDRAIREHVRDREHQEMKQELVALKTEVAQLTELVRSLSRKL